MKEDKNANVDLKGRAWKFGSDIDTDAIIPARYLNTSDPSELAKHCMEDADKDFAKRLKRAISLLQTKTLDAAHQENMRQYQ